ncbi:MAG: hypothetical protein VX768_07490, partial [Planctomycetota bacterium]|nr:hypothetical protein [Planctomycetota bacterium]
ENDEENIEKYYLDLKAANPEADDLKHALFFTALRRDEKAFAMELQRDLAPENGSGFYLSHYVVAMQISKKKGMRREDFELMNRHLKIATLDSRVPEDAFRLLGDGCYAVGQFKSAIESYRKISEPSSEILYKIGLSLLRTDNQSQANDELGRAAEGFQESYDENKQDIRSLILWTKALYFIGRVNESEEILLTALNSNDNVAIRNELIQSYLVQLRSNRNVVRRMEMLKRICELDPSMRINPNTRQAFFALANYLVNENRYLEAKAYYEVCSSRIDFPPSVRNNLAWVEMQLPEGDMEHALKLSTEAIEQARNVRPEFHGTRGQVLARLGEWEKARVELEQALPEVFDKGQVQLALSAVLARLGKQDEAESLFAKIADNDFKTLADLLEKYPK